MIVDPRLNARCCAIADQVEPRYRIRQRSYSCTGHVAKLWGAAYEGARVAIEADAQIAADQRGEWSTFSDCLSFEDAYTDACNDVASAILTGGESATDTNASRGRDFNSSRGEGPQGA